MGMKPYIELKAYPDQYYSGHTIGLFIGSYCLIGAELWRPQAHDPTWLAGFILFNIGFGLWAPVDPE